MEGQSRMGREKLAFGQIELLGPPSWSSGQVGHTEILGSSESGKIKAKNVMN